MAPHQTPPQTIEPGPAATPTAEVAVSIADIRVAARASDPSVRLELAFPDGRFSSSSPHPHIDYTVRVGGVPPDIPGTLLFRASGAWRLYRDEANLYVELFRSTARPSALRLLRLDAETLRGELTVAPTPHDGLTETEVGFVVQPFLHPLLQLLVYWHLARVGGLAFHAGGVVLRGVACMFSGTSGVGKSTITGLCLAAGAEPLSDDRVAVNLRGSTYHAFGTPWHGTPELSRPACAPLGGMFFIEHGEHNELVPLSERDATGLLFARAFPPYFSHELAARALETCGKIAATIPCYRLRFVPDASVVDVLIAALDGRR